MNNKEGGLFWYPCSYDPLKAGDIRWREGLLVPIFSEMGHVVLDTIWEQSGQLKTSSSLLMESKSQIRVVCFKSKHKTELSFHITPVLFARSYSFFWFYPSTFNCVEILGDGYIGLSSTTLWYCRRSETADFMQGIKYYASVREKTKALK